MRVLRYIAIVLTLLLSQGCFRLEKTSSFPFSSSTISPGQHNPHFYFMKGKTALEDGDYKEALKQFQHAIKQQPDFAEAHVGLGHCYRELGKYQRALRSYQRALDYSPDNLTALEGQASTLLQLKDYDQAEKTLQDSLALDPARPSVHKLLGDLHYLNARYPLALQHWEKALTLDPNPNPALRSLYRDLSHYMKEYQTE